MNITYRLHTGDLWQWGNVPTEWLGALAGLLEADTAAYLTERVHPGDCLHSGSDGFWTVDIDAFEVQL